MRWALLSDADRIADYHHQCWLTAFAPLVSDEVMATIEPRNERWRGWLSEGSGFATMVAVDADDIALGHTTVRDDELVHLFIDPAHHRSGLGRQLLEVAEGLVRSAGHPHVHLTTLVGNAPAISLYESCGWVLTDELVESTRGGGLSYTEHVMRKALELGD